MADHASTQTRYPWRALARTLFAVVVALAAGAPIVYQAIMAQDPSLATGWAATVLAVAGAVTRVLALPWTEAFLQRFLPFLAAEPRA